MASKLKIIPLGGMGEIGKNMTAFEYGNDMIVVDCGISFPDDDMPGIDVVIPDMTYLRENRAKFKGFMITHGHEDHVNAALDLAARLDTHLYLHPADLFLWEATYGDAAAPDFELADGAAFTVGGVELVTIHTPGHTPGSVCFYAGALGALFSGDTLFEGGPGATRWDYSSFPGIIESIETRLFPLPDATVVNTGHGPSTTIGGEAPHLGEWIARGW